MQRGILRENVRTVAKEEPEPFGGGASLQTACTFLSADEDALAMERTEEAARPTVIGLINGANTAGYLVAPAISAWVQARYGFGPLFVVTAICYLLAALANYWFFVRGETAGRVKRPVLEIGD